MEYQEMPAMVPKQPSMTPWILFALVLVAGIGAVLVEDQKLDAATMRVTTTVEAEKKARAEAVAAMQAQKTLENRVQELQAENGRLAVKVSAAAKSSEQQPAKTHASKKARRKHKRHHSRGDSL
jgi:Sec-independent protein translocase protein TatA